MEFSPRCEIHPEWVVKVSVLFICRAAQFAHHQSDLDTERQLPHGKHMLSLIAAVSAG